jgi:cullin 1
VSLAEDSTPIYLIKAEIAFDEESKRVHSYLNALSEPKLMGVLERELLENKKMALLEKEGSGLLVLLANDKEGDLARMFQLFSRLKESGLAPMADIFKNFVVKLGQEKIEARRARIESLKTTSEATAGEKVEKETNNDPQFIRDLIALHDKYTDMVTHQFGSSSLFQKALADAFTLLVNKDIGKFKNADLMSSFCDQLLKGGEKLSDGEVEVYLEKIVQLFSYLADKDLFAEIYRSYFRLVLLLYIDYFV